MITKDAAKKINARALAYRRLELTQESSTPLILPKQRIKDPKKWVVMVGKTICPNGSMVRFNRGDEVDQKWLYNELIDAGAQLAPIE
jgi:hypothetical protein